MRRLVSVYLGVLLLLSVAPAGMALDITADTTWSGAKVVDETITLVKGTLLIEPDSRITFGKAGVIQLGAEAMLRAGGSAEKPIVFSADHAGKIVGRGPAVFEHCRFTGLGANGEADKPSHWMQASADGEGIVFRSCSFQDCSVLEIGGGQLGELSGCDFRDCRGEIRMIGRKLRIVGNTIKGASLSGYEADVALVKDNVVVDGGIGGFVAFRIGQKDVSDADRKDAQARVGNVLIENNYVHWNRAGGKVCLGWVSGTIRGNLFRGATWTCSRVAGVIRGNVIESVPEVVFKKSGNLNDFGTHEHICGTFADTLIERNLFVHPSYGAIMGIGAATCTGNIIRNNTFDMRGVGEPIYLNHLPESNPRDIVIRNNLFLRGGMVMDERGIPDSASYCDYNAWVPVHAKGRFSKVSLTGRQEGSPGFGGHDIADKDMSPDQVIENTKFEFPYDDEDLLARKHRVADCIELYRKAYSLKAGSPAINAGDPQDKDDPEVKDGRCDIGAVEFRNSTPLGAAPLRESDAVPASQPNR